MKGKGLSVLLFFLVIVQLMSAQKSDIETIVSRGVADYEMGKYESALEWFKQAYKLDKSSNSVLYELALTYLALGDYQTAAIYSSKLINKKGEYKEDAYLINGSAWDNLNREQKAQKIFKKGIREFSSNHLLHYNLALSYFKDKRYDKAQDYVVNAIEIYPAHASSHLLLAYVMFEKGERVQSMLPLYYFLLLEQDSDRSSTAYDLLSSLWNQGVRDKGQRDIQLVRAGFNYSDFATAELAVSMIKASESVKTKKAGENLDNPDNKKLAKFAENNQVLFKILEEASIDKNGFWWDFYVNFFSKIRKNNFSEPFSYFISSCRYNNDVLLWMSDNHIEFQRFTTWMEVQ